MLQGHFPASLHEDLLNEIGLSPNLAHPQRDPAFRQAVIRARSVSEGVASLAHASGSVAKIPTILRQWPSVPQNGLALCAIHHKGLDRGAIGVGEDLTILISGNLHGQTGIAEWFLAFKGKKIRQPHSSTLLPGQEFLAWHRKEVFRPPPRE